MRQSLSPPRDGSKKAAVAALAVIAVYSSLLQFGLADRLASLYPDPYNVMEMQARVIPVLDAVPPAEPIGYFSDVPFSVSAGRASFLAAQHAFAPRILLKEDSPSAKRAKFWLGVFQKQENFAEIGAKRGLEMERDLGGYVVFYRRQEAAR
ncbi:MAG: hypothetical protein WHT08_15735 [Bryobacteraceae bacterium]|jgi:hypothetical protein